MSHGPASGPPPTARLLPSTLHLVALLWIVHILRLVLGVLGLLPIQTSARIFGIHPGSGVTDLWTVFTAPLIHGDWRHLFGNSVSLLILGSLVGLRGRGQLWQVSIISAFWRRAWESGWLPPTTRCMWGPAALSSAIWGPCSLWAGFSGAPSASCSPLPV